MDTSKSSVFPLEYIFEFKGWGFRDDVSICIIRILGRNGVGMKELVINLIKHHKLIQNTHQQTHP